MRRGPAISVLAVATLAGCAGAGDPAPGPPATASATATAPPEVTLTGYVLESPTRRPVLCDGLRESYPPSCDGPELVGWSWRQVPPDSSVRGTSWGRYELVGVWADGRFQVHRAAPAPG